MEKELEAKQEFLKEDKDEVVEIVDGKRVRYNFSFEARLSQTSEENKTYYQQIQNTLAGFGVKVSRSWKQERIYLGRKTYGAILFKGKRLCVAMALNPKDYEETKYKGIDLSDVKRFEEIPMLMKLTSDRKMKYVKELLKILFETQGFVFKEAAAEEFQIPYESTEDLLAKGLVKPVVSKARKPVVTETVILEEPVQTEAVILDEPEKKEKTYLIKACRRGRRAIVNLGELKALDGVITLDILKEKGFVSKNARYVKLLGNGIVAKPLVIEVHAYSQKAYQKLISVKGTIKKI